MAKKTEVQDTAVLDAAGNVITSNSTEVTFPTDIWGLTSDLKADIKYLAARICGCPEKYALVQETLRIALGYLDARVKDDAEALKNV